MWPTARKSRSSPRAAPSHAVGRMGWRPRAVPLHQWAGHRRSGQRLRSERRPGAGSVHLDRRLSHAVGTPGKCQRTDPRPHRNRHRRRRQRVRRRRQEPTGPEVHLQRALPEQMGKLLFRQRRIRFPQADRHRYRGGGLRGRRLPDPEVWACPGQAESPNVHAKAGAEDQRPTRLLPFRSASARVRFQCRMTGQRVPKRLRRWRRCGSPKRYRGLRPGRKSFEVRALSGAGAKSKPARYLYRVVG